MLPGREGVQWLRSGFTSSPESLASRARPFWPSFRRWASSFVQRPRRSRHRSYVDSERNSFLRRSSRLRPKAMARRPRRRAPEPRRGAGHPPAGGPGSKRPLVRRNPRSRPLLHRLSRLSRLRRSRRLRQRLRTPARRNPQRPPRTAPLQGQQRRRGGPARVAPRPTRHGGGSPRAHVPRSSRGRVTTRSRRAPPGWAEAPRPRTAGAPRPAATGSRGRRTGPEAANARHPTPGKSPAPPRARRGRVRAPR